MTSEIYNDIPVCIELPITNDFLPEMLFSHWANQPWSFWLDSCESDHVDAHFDIMVWQPTISITREEKINTVHWFDENRQADNHEQPFELINQLLKTTFANVKNTSKLPFCGGMIGLFNYDIGRSLERLPRLAEKDIKTPDMHVGIYHSAVVYDRKMHVLTLVTLLKNFHTLHSSVLQLLSKKPKKNIGFSLTSDWQANMDKAQYENKFNQVQEYLLAGDCYQINLAQRFTASYSGDEFSAYLALRASNQAPFSAFCQLPNATVLSISPERFIKLTDNKVQTKPIKGTIARHKDESIDKKNANLLQNSEKDRAENLMIVDLLRNDISKVCQAGSVVVPSLFAIESFPSVHHLVSTIEGELSEHKTASDIFTATFPGGSITGAPKIRAMEIIEELEPHQRNIYCGSIGYISACGNMDSNITIRTLITHNQKIYCWAGGGLVADSTINNEYQETYDKVNKILPVLTHLKHHE